MAVRDQKLKVWVLGALLLLLVTNARQATALETTWTGRAGAMASNNIDRSQPETEEGGYLLTTGFLVNVTEATGRRSMRLLMYGGRENRKAETSQEGESYSLLLGLNFPWTASGSINLSAATSQQTETPESDDLVQAREPVTRSSFDLAVGNRPSLRTDWQIKAGAREEFRTGREVVEAHSGMSWSRELTRTLSLSLQGDLVHGEDDFDASRWKNSTAQVEVVRKRQQSEESGLRLGWERLDVDEADGTHNIADQIGLRFFYRLQRQSGWTHGSDLGLETIRTKEGDGELEPIVELTGEGPMDRKTSAFWNLSYTSRLRDPYQVDSAWVNQGRIRAGLTWEATRTFSVSPSLTYSKEDHSGGGDPSRVDEITTTRLGLSMGRPSSLNVTLVGTAETRDSTDDSYELEEGRVELTLSAQLL